MNIAEACATQTILERFFDRQAEEEVTDEQKQRLLVWLNNKLNLGDM